MLQVGAMELAIILAVGLFTSGISSRVTQLAHRGRVSRPLKASNSVRDIVGLFAGLSFWALVLWGFSSLDWYVVLPIAVVAGSAAGVIANPPRWEFFYRFEPVVNLVTLGVTGWLWATHWPY